MKVRQWSVCQECRSRKLGCDGKQPSCSQCLLRDRECSGYPANVIFLSPLVSKPHAGKADGTGKRTIKREKAKKQRPPVTSLHANYRSILRPLNWPLRDIISLCAQNFIPASELCLSSSDPAITQSRICGSWVEVLPVLIDKGEKEYLNLAIRAFGASILASGCDGRAPVSDAVEAQCLALHSLQESIHQASASSFSEVAATIMCLFLSEMLLPTSHISSAVHAEGIAQLIQLRQPRFYAAGIPHKLFVGFRPMLILHAFITRKSTFLANDIWKRDPFQRMSATPLQVVLSMASPIPSILEKLDGSRSTPVNQQNTIASDALVGLVEVLEHLQLWHRETLDAYSGPMWWVKSGTDDETHVWFCSITMANCLTHFWAFWIICVTNIRQLREEHPDLRERGIHVDGQPPESEFITERLLRRANRIILSVEFLTQDKMKLFGVASAFLPLQTACSLLEDSDSRSRAAYSRRYRTISQSRYRDILLL